MNLHASTHQHLLEKRWLQAAIMIGCIVPLSGGVLGLMHGAGMVGSVGDVTLDSHVRYLSGLLLGVGLGFLSAIPNIEKHSDRVALLTAIVVTGGMARLYGILSDGWPAPPMVFALGMELGVVPVLWCWQRRVAQQRVTGSSVQPGNGS